jgi:hypothetical protein
VSASELIEKIQRLPDDQARQVHQYLFSAESELDRVLPTFDRLPRKSPLTEEETLALPRPHQPLYTSPQNQRNEFAEKVS